MMKYILKNYSVIDGDRLLDLDYLKPSMEMFKLLVDHKIKIHTIGYGKIPNIKDMADIMSIDNQIKR